MSHQQHRTDHPFRWPPTNDASSPVPSSSRGSHEEKKEEDEMEKEEEGLLQHFSSSCPSTPPSPDATGEDVGDEFKKLKRKSKSKGAPTPALASPDDTARTATTATAATTSPSPVPPPLLPLLPHHRRSGGGANKPLRYTALRDVLPCAAPSPDDDAEDGDDGAGGASFRDDDDDDEEHTAWRPPVSSLPVPPPSSAELQRVVDGSSTTGSRSGASYYRVTYRGVVALLREPRRHAPKSGVYLGYGEVFLAAPVEAPVDSLEVAALRREADRTGSSDCTGAHPTLSPRRRPRPTAATAAASLQMPPPPPPPPPPCLPRLPGELSSSRGGGADHNNNNNDDDADRALLVLHVLTGGYAREEGSDAAPGLWGYLFPSALPSASSFGGASEEERIVERLLDVPSPSPQHVPRSGGGIHGCGNWTVRVVAPAPVPVVAGPCDGAPRTAATLLPGSTHDVSLSFGDYLRLHHRRGWIRATQQQQLSQSAVTSGQPGPAPPAVVAVVEAPDQLSLSRDAHSSNANFNADSSAEGASLASGTTATAGGSSCASFAGLSQYSQYSQRTNHYRRPRHRPPRRALLPPDGADDPPRPRHIAAAGMVAAHGTAASVARASSSPAKVQLDHERLGASLISDSDEPDEGCASSEQSSQPPDEPVYLMRVWNPHGLKILDAPHFAVSHLIRGSTGHDPTSSSSASASHPLLVHPRGGFATVPHLRAPHHPTPAAPPAVVFDSHSRTRRLPAGAYFEARTLLQPALYHGEGLVQLLDKTGWAVVPDPSDVEAVAQSSSSAAGSGGILSPTPASAAGSEWVRVAVRAGVAVVCPPPPSLTFAVGSKSSSAPPSPSSVRTGASGSDVASSVGSSLLDVFRTPTKKPAKPPAIERAAAAPKEAAAVAVIPCGTPVRVDRPLAGDYARLFGGQGWIPLRTQGREGAAASAVAALLPTPPEHRFGSFWFRVQAPRGIRARIGPSRRAPSIRSAAGTGVGGRGTYLRFECGEFLRASEIVTILPPSATSDHHENDGGDPGVAECYCKLYRNRHAVLHQQHGREHHRPLEAYTAPAEWVQVYDGAELFLEECAREPRIERHPQGGWKYRASRQVPVRRGPSFAAETVGLLEEGESVLVLERVAPPGDPLLWLRLKDGAGWVHDTCQDTKEPLLVPHSQRHKLKKEKEEIAYNTIIARLFHTDNLHEGRSTSNLRGGGL